MTKKKRTLDERTDNPQSPSDWAWLLVVVVAMAVGVYYLLIKPLFG